jgi:hypothetical protein
MFLQGLTTEIALKVDADVSDELSFSGKVCHGCHGFEVDRAYVDYAPHDLFNVKAGRVPVPFGEFNTRHDPSNHKTSSKPLPYAMGHMARYQSNQFNLGVLPVPYVDQGAVVYGNAWPTDFLQLYYAGYVVAGFKGTNDFDFIRQRSPYYVDNNRDVAVGGRALLTVVDAPTLPDWLIDLSLGASLMNGAYDDASRLKYWIAGSDLTLRLRWLTLRAEYAMRRTDIDTSVSGYIYEPGDNFITKAGFYVEIEHPLGSIVEAVYRFDGLDRRGVPLPGNTITSTNSRIRRYTQGINFLLTTAFKLKLGYEYWWFSEFKDIHVGHSSIVGTF